MAQQPQIQQSLHLPIREENPMHEEQIKTFFAEQNDISIAIVFGSCSRDQATPLSDYDIAVASEQALTAERKIDLIKALSSLTLRPIDLIDLHTARHPILQSILTSGKSIKKTDTELYAKFLRRLWNWKADMSGNYNYILSERRKRAFAKK
jgi:predicted nucleotidyltransferase